MPRVLVCRGCGVKVPWLVGACPSCGTWLGRRWMILGGLGTILVVIGVAVLVVDRFRDHSTLGPLADNVHIGSSTHKVSADGRGTDVSGTFTNKNLVPVDVTVRIEGLDITDTVVVSHVLGPFKNIPSGRTHGFTHRFETTPLKTVRFELSDISDASGNDENAKP